LSQLLLSRPNGAHDIRIAGTATEISREILSSLFIGRIGRLIEKRFNGKNETWGTISALQGALAHESFLNNMERLAVTQAFYGHDVVSRCANREEEA